MEDQKNSFRILSVNLSEKKGTVKLPVPGITVNEHGVEGDAHAGDWDRQVSILGSESIKRFSEVEKRKISYGEFAENITTEGFDLLHCIPLDRFQIGSTELEITQIGKECHGTACAIFKETGNCIMPKEGIFCRVIKQGIIKPGMTGIYIPKIFRIFILTLSNRASKGIYDDKSGPRVKELISDFLSTKKIRYIVDNEIIPDNAVMLRSIVREKSFLSDIIITTGGTGIGPDDITIEVVKSMLDKEIPGIMEFIRLKYGADYPQALLSRSVAGIMGNSLVFTLPGSLKAVNEYMEEILKSLLHCVYMKHGLSMH
jgi:molybdenum cofactor synthesis domain-containing protein